jgi:hypothetical protein
VLTSGFQHISQELYRFRPRIHFSLILKVVKMVKLMIAG